MKTNTIFYDTECPICVREIELILQDCRADTTTAIPIQGNEPLLQQHGITAEQAMTYLHVLTADGVMLRGMPAVRKRYENYQGFAIVKLANLPVLNVFADWFYPYFAQNRYRFPKWLLPRPECENGVCHVKPSKRVKK